MSAKVCKDCLQSLPPNDFPIKDASGARRPRCKACYNAHVRDRRGVTKRKPHELPPGRVLGDYKKDAEIRKLKTQQHRLVETLSHSQRRVEVLNALENNMGSNGVERRERASGQREATAVVLCSDWHVEETVDREKTNGLNEYNLDIAERRIVKLTEGLLWLTEMNRTKMHVRDLVLWLGGDLMTGALHEDLAETNGLSTTETILWLQVKITGMIDWLLEAGKFEQIVVVTSIGNHGRLFKKPRIATAAENSYEWLLYKTLQAHYLDEPRIKWSVSKAPLTYLRVYDQMLRFTHGDLIRYAGGVGGFSVPIFKALHGWNQGVHADVTIMGHFHSLTFHENFVVNGSLIGTNSFSMSIKASDKPRQAFFLMDSEHGKTGMFPIWVDESGSAEAQVEQILHEAAA